MILKGKSWICLRDSVSKVSSDVNMVIEATLPWTRLWAPWKESPGQSRVFLLSFNLHTNIHKCTHAHAQQHMYTQPPSTCFLLRTNLDVVISKATIKQNPTNVTYLGKEGDYTVFLAISHNQHWVDLHDFTSI